MNRASYFVSWSIPSKFLGLFIENCLLFQKNFSLLPPIHPNRPLFTCWLHRKGITCFKLLKWRPDEKGQLQSILVDPIKIFRFIYWKSSTLSEKVIFTPANLCHLVLDRVLHVNHYIENAQIYSLWKKNHFANRASYSASRSIPAKFLHFLNGNHLLFQKKSLLLPPIHPIWIVTTF